MTRATILVVEDHPLNRELVVDLFTGDQRSASPPPSPPPQVGEGQGGGAEG